MKKTLLAACALLVVSAAGATAGAQAADGKTIYGEQCKKCHGATGTPPAAMVKKFKKLAALDAKLLDKVSEDSIVAVITKGRGDMKALTDKMSAPDIKAVAKYVKETMAAAK